VGYGEWDVVRWAADQQCFYDAACAEWAEAGALHFTGRGTLQDFIQVRRIRRHRHMHRWKRSAWALTTLTDAFRLELINAVSQPS
jgi:hypothetical protein